MTSDKETPGYEQYERRRKQVNVTMSKRELLRLVRLANTLGYTPSTLAKMWLLERMTMEEKARGWEEKPDDVR